MLVNKKISGWLREDEYCFGAVVLTYEGKFLSASLQAYLCRAWDIYTLKATGVWLIFLILRICDTSEVNGPRPISNSLRRFAGQPTMETQLLRINFDRHGDRFGCYLEVLLKLMLAVQ